MGDQSPGRIGVTLPDGHPDERNHHSGRWYGWRPRPPWRQQSPEAFARLADLDIAAFLFNCTTPDAICEGLRQLSTLTDKPIGPEYIAALDKALQTRTANRQS
jgi:hypothetical protein